MTIWHGGKAPDISDFKNVSINMLAHLGIEITCIKENSITGTMPVDNRTTQPFGLLHGGASCVLAESLGSIASNLVVDSTQFRAVGLCINANHIKSVTSGIVTGIATPIHLGSRTHVWDISISDEQKRLICSARLTTAIVTI